MQCPKCGDENKPDSKFCRKCGNNLEEQQKIFLQEQERLAQERKKDEERLAQERKEQQERLPAAPVPTHRSATPGPVYSPAAVPLRPDDIAVQPVPTKGVMHYTIVGWVFAGVFLAAAGGTGYWYYQKQEAEKVADEKRESTYPYCTVKQLRNVEGLKTAYGCPKQPSSQTEAPVYTINAAQDIANEFRRSGCPNVEANLANAICNSVEFSCWNANTRQTTIAVKRVCDDIYVTLADSNGVQTKKRHYRLERNATNPGITQQPAANPTITQQPATNPTTAVLAMLDAAKNQNNAAILSAKVTLDSFPKPNRGDRKIARERNKLGLDALKVNNYEIAIARLNEGLTADPSDVELKNNLGYALMIAGRLDDARKTLIESLVLDSARGAAWANLGQTLAKQGDEASAVAAFVNTFMFSRAQNKTVEYFTNLSQSDPDPRVKSAAAKALETPIMKGIAVINR